MKASLGKFVVDVISIGFKILLALMICVKSLRAKQVSPRKEE